MRAADATLGVVLVVLVALLLWVIVVYNNLVRGRNRVREAWSGIDVQLRRRGSLVPNLVETVRDYHELDYPDADDPHVVLKQWSLARRLSGQAPPRGRSSR